jgi:hypothetical protein
VGPDVTLERELREREESHLRHASRSNRRHMAELQAFAARALAEGLALATDRLTAWSESESDARTTLRSSVWAHRAGRWQMVFHRDTATGEPLPSG